MDNNDIEGILMLGLYRNSTGSYMQTIVPKEVVLEQVLDSIRGWAKMTFPEFDIDYMPVEDVMALLGDIACPE